VIDFTEAEAKKANLVKDPLAAMAEVNSGNLTQLLRSVETNDAALKEMIAGLAAQNDLRSLASNDPPGADPDDVPEPLDLATTKRGDVWLLGRHRLHCGNPANAKEVDRLLQGENIHMGHCDLQYGVRVEPDHPGLDCARHARKSKPSAKRPRAKARRLINDVRSETKFDRLLRQWCGNLARVLLPGRGFVIWINSANLGNYSCALEECGLHCSQAIVWDKGWPKPTKKVFMSAFELAFFGWKEGAGCQFYGPSNVTDLWHVKKPNRRSMIHLKAQPVELATRAIEYCSRPGESVLDLVGGCGSTLIGAEMTGRRAFVMEIDPHYCDVIRSRYEQLTGKKAQLRRDR
jgi:DNA modification methylase